MKKASTIAMTDHEHMEAIRAIAASSGRMQEHLKWLLDYHDRRTTELLTYNNDQVEQRRGLERRLEALHRLLPVDF